MQPARLDTDTASFINYLAAPLLAGALQDFNTKHEAPWQS
jgi:hypothetical protein